MSQDPAPGFLTWIVLRATHLVPEPTCERLEEEWLADLFALEGIVRRSQFALGCWWAALQMRGDCVATTVSKAAQRSVIDELPAVMPGIGLRKPRGQARAAGAGLRTWMQRRSRGNAVARVAKPQEGPEDRAVEGGVCALSAQCIPARHGRHPAVNAAAALIAVGVVALPYVRDALCRESLTESMGTVYTSDARSVRRVAMPDGTQLVLRHGSRVAIWYNGNVRAAQLLRGAATFAVPRDTARAFVLDAGDRHFASTGGTFDVRLHEGFIELTVLKGEMSVSAPARPTLVKAGQTIAIDRAGNPARQKV